jgi:hypothetical protein
MAIPETSGAVAAGVAAASALCACPALVDAWSRREAPPTRLVMMERRGVGKTSLTNALTASSAPTGLGGVTRERRAAAGGGFEIVDLPGLEQLDGGAGALAAALAEVDAVVWLIDGLMPGTATERAALARAVPPWARLVALVGRADLLDAGERDDIRGRVRELVSPWRPAPILFVDGRAPGAEVVVELARVDWARSPRRVVALRAGLDDARAALGHLPVPPDPAVVAAEAAAAWRDAARAAHATTARAVERGALGSAQLALEALHGALDEAASSLEHRLSVTAGLGWSWRPERPDARWDLRVALGGASAILRALRAEAGRAASAGEIACAALERGGEATAMASRRAALLASFEAVDRARTALPGPEGAAGIER